MPRRHNQTFIGAIDRRAGADVVVPVLSEKYLTDGLVWVLCVFVVGDEAALVGVFQINGLRFGCLVDWR